MIKVWGVQSVRESEIHKNLKCSRSEECTIME